MNRERLLFVSVLAILALWYFLRSPERPVAPPTPHETQLDRRPILPASYTPTVLGVNPREGAFTQPTNVRPHPRPVEALEKPRDFDLPNIWPPTSRGLSIDRLDQLRRDAAAPRADQAAISLPKAADEGAGTGVAVEERVDTWKSNNADQRGHVHTIVAGGAQLKLPVPPWPYGEAVVQANQWKFLRALVLLPDPERAVPEEGVQAVWAKSAKIGDFRQAYPADINSFQIAVAGRAQGYFHGLKTYLDVRRQAGQAHEPRVRAGQQLLEQGLAATREHREDLLRWSLALLDEARKLVPAGAEEARRGILLLMLKAAGALNDHELVLSLAIDHLAAFPQSPEVLEYVGNVLASRSFSLAPFAVEWFVRASDRTSAQRRAIEEMVREGRFDEAGQRIAQGLAGTPGPVQDLLKARVALARGDLDNAAAFAARHEGAGGAIGAEALQLLGGIAYAKGDAAAAADRFEAAAKADPGRSTAFSDWGHALAVQGRTEDALLCYAHAFELDAIDNAVAPHLGRGYLKLAAGEAALRAAVDAEDAARKDPKVAAQKAEDAARLRTEAKDAFAAAAELLGKLQDDNRADLLVLYMLGYAKERTGNVKEAAELYRSTIDGDARYRIAIARLGVVQSKLALEGRDPKDAAAAIAHLLKAVELSPQEAILPYVLARFLMMLGDELQLELANQMFAKAVNLPVSERNGNLPLWAELGQACLAYANEAKETLEARRLLNSLLERIKDKMPAGTQEPKLMEHEVYRAGRIDLQIVEENERKTDRTWDFASRPADWTVVFKSPMEIRFDPATGLTFQGTIDYQGVARTPKSALEYCAIAYKPSELTGGSFWELEVTGVVPAPGAGDPGELGIGIIQPIRGDQVLGVQARRKRAGTLEVRLDGGDRQVFKDVKTNWVELKEVPWPAGEFKLRLEVVPEYGTGKRRQGRFRLLLNGEEVFFKEYKNQQGERANIFAPSKANQVLELYLWVEGREGAEVKEIQVKTVTLTVESAK